MKDYLYATVWRVRFEGGAPLPSDLREAALLDRACAKLLGECRWGKHRLTEDRLADRFDRALNQLQTRLHLREGVLAMLTGHGAGDEEAGPKTDPRIEVFLDRVLLRFFATPSVIVYLRDARVNPDGTIEMVFSELPEEVIPKIAGVVGVPDGEAYAFNDKTTQYPYTGYRFKPREEDLAGIVLGTEETDSAAPSAQQYN